MPRNNAPAETASHSSSESYDERDDQWEPDDQLGLLSVRPQRGQQADHDDSTPKDSSSDDDDNVLDVEEYYASRAVRNDGQDARVEGPVQEQGGTEMRRVGRTYQYVNRRRADYSTLGKRTARWLRALEVMTEPKLRRTTCCKALKCFRKVNYEHYLSRARHVVNLSVFARRTFLQSMKGSNGTFHFDGKQVCSRFLKKGFHFSTGLMAAENNASISKGCSSSDQAMNGNVRSVTVTQRSSKATSSSTSDAARGRGIMLQKDTVVSFLRRLSEDCSDRMPDSGELHLPFFRKYDVYTQFVDEYRKLYPSSDAPTQHYFLRTWKEHCRNIKVRRSTRFTICDECERLREALRKAISDNMSTADIRRQKRTHIDYITEERLCYQMKRDRSRLQNSEYCSIIVDGADQSAFGLPHFTTTTKSQRGHALKVKLVGLLEHNIENRLFLFTMTEEHQTGANHIVESVHRFLNIRSARGPLPRTLFVQLDNCSRENKNHFFLSYLEFLVAVRLFDVIEVGFLPVGHTHEDIDQVFSQTSARLRANTAITLDQLHYQLQNVNNGNTDVQHMKRLVNWSDLCNQENCIRRVDNITQPHYFKFCRSFHSTDDVDVGTVSTCCFVKHKNSDAWVPLFKSANRSDQGILKSVPDLRRTPPTSVTCPTGLEKVTKRFVSEESRINNTDNMVLLHELRDHVFRTREEPFHWELSTAVEGKYLRTDSVRQLENNEVEEDQIEAVITLSAPSLARKDPSPSHVSSEATTHTDPLQDLDISHPAHQQQHQIESRSEPNTQRKTLSTIQTAKTAAPFTKVIYDVGSFVLVRPENDDDRSTGSFWTAKILAVEHQDNETFVRRLRVQWYDVHRDHRSTDRRMAPFFPMYQPLQTKRKASGKTRSHSRAELQQPWVDVIDTDSVLVSFPSLTRRNTLPLNAQKKIPL